MGVSFYECAVLCCAVLCCAVLCCAVCVCVCVSDQIRVPAKSHITCQLSKLIVCTHKICIKVPRFDMCTSMISLSKIAHQMWREHPFSQRNMTTEWAVGVGVGGNRELGGEGLGKIWKKGVGNIGGIFKI